MLSHKVAFAGSCISCLIVLSIFIIVGHNHNIFSSTEKIISGSIFSSLNHTDHNDIVIIDYSNDNITRANLASLIQKLSNDRVRSVLLDVNLSQASENYVDDNLLMETLAANKKLDIIIPIYKKDDQVIRPLSLFSKHAKTGFIDISTVNQDTYSEFDLVLNTASNKYFHASSILAKQNNVVDRSYIQPGIDISSIPVINFSQVNNQSDQYFSNKIVIAGENIDRSINSALLIDTLKNGKVSKAPWYLVLTIFLILAFLLNKQFISNQNRFQVLLLAGFMCSLPVTFNYISIIFFRTLFPSFLLTIGIILIIAYLAYIHRDHYSFSLKTFKLDNKPVKEDNSIQELLEGDISIGKNGVILKADPIASKLLGFKNQNLVGSPLRKIAPNLNQDKWLSFYHDLMDMKNPTEHLFELKAKHQNGKNINLQLQPKQDNYISATVAHFHLRNTKGKSGSQVALEYQAKQDKVSRTLNFSGIDEHVTNLIDNKGDSTFSVALLRIDNFSEIENTLGEDSARKIIKSFSERLHQTTTNIATIGRTNISDFVIIFDNKAYQESIKKILNSSKNAIHASGISIELSIHAGIALYPDHGKTTKQLFKNAKMALIKAISNQNAYEVCKTEKRKAPSNNNNSLSKIHTALKKNQFQLHYQPIIDVNSHSVSSVEALIRWQHPEKGLLAPRDFISQIEHSKLVRPITKWVINTALKDARNLEQHGLDIAVSVNISEINLLDAHFPTLVAECINKNKMTANSIEFEISEKKLHLISEQALKLLKRFKNNGVNFTLDNYGAENTSLLNLRELPFSKIKIHQSLISKVIKSNSDAVVVDAIIRLAHGFDIPVVAEGVESELHYKKLRDLDIDYCQGHLFSKPMNIQSLIKLFETWNNNMDDSQEIPAQAMATWNGQFNNS